MDLFPNGESLVFLPSSKSVFQLAVFKYLFLISLLLKDFIEKKRLYPSIIDKGTFIYEKYIALKRTNRLAFIIYRKTFGVRFFLIVVSFFPFGTVLPIITLIVLSISYLSESYCLFRFHLIVIIIVILHFLIDINSYWIDYSKLNSLLYIEKNLELKSLVHLRIFVAIILLSSSRRKLQFSYDKGAALKETALFSLHTGQRKYDDHGNSLTRYILKELVIPNYKLISRYIIYFQGLAGILLITDSVLFIKIGALIGIVLQIGIINLFPKTLSFFSLIMLAIYIVLI